LKAPLNNKVSDELKMAAINRITDLDVTALQRLREESLREGYRFMERLCEEWVSGANQFNGPGEVLFLAVAEGEVVGVCGLNRDPYAHDARTGRVRRLYVLPTHRHSGIGLALLEAVIAHAHGNFDLLCVRTEAANDFYTARGFRRDVSDSEATHVLELANAA
jgi:GNAT superfamily N-acetyltransferase